MTRQDERVIVGRIVGLNGVRGWVKIESYTEPRINIKNYNPWLLQLQGESCCKDVQQVKAHGKGMLAKFDGIDDRDSAAAWVSAEICVARQQLAELPQGEYYWRDLIGLQVSNLQDESLGVVESLMETGANDVLVVKQAQQETLIPWLPQQVIVDVDLESGEMRVDWQLDDQEADDAL